MGDPEGGKKSEKGFLPECIEGAATSYPQPVKNDARRLSFYALYEKHLAQSRVNKIKRHKWELKYALIFVGYFSAVSSVLLTRPGSKPGPDPDVEFQPYLGFVLTTLNATGLISVNSLVSLLVEYIVMLGRPWFLRNVGGAAIEHPGDRQRTRDNLGKSSFSSIQTERFLAAILQIAIMFLLGVCGTHEHIVSLNISVASVLGDPLYLKIFVAGMTLYRCSFKAPISLAQRYLCKAGHNIAAALLPIVTTGLSMSSLPWSLVLAAPRRMRGAVVYQVIHTLWFPPPERRHHSQIVSPPIVQSNTQEPIFAAPLVSLPPLFLALARVKPTSREFPPMLELFLRSKEHKLLARLEKSTAVCVADVLDEFLHVLPLSCPPEHWKLTLRLLRLLCGSWGVLPTSYTFQGEVEFLDEHPFFRSHSAEVYRGTSAGEMVAAKVLTICLSDSPSRLNKRLSKEAVIWKRLSHPNILPFYGVYYRDVRPCLISPWMLGGNIRDFAIKNPHLNQFKLLVDVCRGLQYLHEQDIVHGDLKGDNVLIDSEPRARLSDFGLASFDRSRWPGVTSNSSEPGGTTAYMAPELFHREHVKGQSNAPLMRKEADIYALGMLIYEVLSGKRPFHGVHRHVIGLRVLRGERPRRTSSAAIPDLIWEMLQACWSDEPTQRPTIGRVIAVCMVHASQDVLAVGPPNFSSGSSGSSPSQVLESNSDSSALWCSSPVGG